MVEFGPILLGLLAVLALLLLILVIRKHRSGGQPALSSAPRDTARLAPQSATIGPSLVLVSATGESIYALSPQGLTIGRAPDNDLVIDASIEGAETVSDHHARIYFDMGHWIVKDLDSQNGVYVNERRTGHNLLEDGWLLQVGGVAMTFYESAEEAGS